MPLVILVILGDLHSIKEIGSGRSGPVFVSIIQDKKVAIKIADISKRPDVEMEEMEMINEVGIYRFLKELQGVTIPQLVHFEYVTEGLLALITEFAGSSLKLKDMTDEVKQQAIDSLRSLHRCGVLHGDVRPSWLIDFGFSRRILNDDEDEAECEMQSLRLMLNLEE